MTTDSAEPATSRPWHPQLVHTPIGAAVAAVVLEDTAPSTRAHRKVNRHAAVMSVVIVLSVVEIFVRRGHYADAASTLAVIVALSLLTSVLVTVGGELGGRLICRSGIGVRVPRSDPEPAAADRPVR